ncbi:MAG: peptide chain release factor 2 [Acidiferrobacteraceae bacterium]|nr:peptide chain release factor 2 [Acidiferrobacteraceae bacterium]
MDGINDLRRTLDSFFQRIEALRGYLDYTGQKEHLEEILLRLEDSSVWKNPDLAQSLNEERSRLEAVVHTLDQLENQSNGNLELVELAAGENDLNLLVEIQTDIQQLSNEIARLEFQRMFSGEADKLNSFLDIQAGSGGTEAQDWAEMLLRMYAKWSESSGFNQQIIEKSQGDVAGVKSATIKIVGNYAYGHLRTETGIHRLVRKSPFDSGNRRHTSFASVFAYPEIDDTIEVTINPADLRIDTYRASGAGGQHVNRTDSAVRITHNPSGIVVQCQNDRSQHRNKAEAMIMLRARLYESEIRKKKSEQQLLEDSKADIGWGHQIRSYVLDQSRIKDLRTGHETRNTQFVLDGGLNQFIETSLKAGL